MDGFDISKYDNIFLAVSTLKNVEELRCLFEDMCTIKELEAMSQRLNVAAMLKNGANYQQVIASTGASTATISRVNKCLMYGKGGYALVLDKEDKE